jgi:cytochrome c
VKTVGSYWPYATTLFDYVRRAMPYDRPMSLSSDEVYAISAYLLFQNDIIPEGTEMNSKTLPNVEMPNRHGFVDYSSATR